MVLDLIPGKKIFVQRDVRETANIAGTPAIADFTSAQHNHSDGATGGTISHTNLTDDGTNTHAQIDTHISNSSAHGSSGNILGATTAAATYAPIANGVTNGNSHDHNGGDGNQINHTTCSNIGTNTHAQIDTHLAATAPHTGHVDTAGDETISGVKTFSSFPISPSSAPASDYQVANKKYVDDSIGSGATSRAIILGTFKNYIGDATTVYIATSGATDPTVGCDSTEYEVNQIIPYNCTLKNLYGNCYSNSIDGTTTITIRKNAADTALVISWGSTTSGAANDTVHTVDFTAGDRICLKFASAGSSGQMDWIGWGFEVDPR